LIYNYNQNCNHFFILDSDWFRVELGARLEYGTMGSHVTQYGNTELPSYFIRNCDNYIWTFRHKLL